MDKYEINPGDVVILKSEANLCAGEQHRMTATTSDKSTRQLTCYWFNGNDIMIHDFHRDVLFLVDQSG